MKIILSFLISCIIFGCMTGKNENPSSTHIDYPKYLNNPHPYYPLGSRISKEEGKTIIKLLISNQGLVKKAEIEESSGYTRLDKTALKTVKNWTFVPAKSNGEPIDFWVMCPVKFMMPPDEKNMLRKISNKSINQTPKAESGFR